MATINENKEKWDYTYDWKNKGHEWSGAWGGTFMQWYGMILPRIRTFLPSQTILEIAPGYGRWIYFLKDMCESLLLVDLSDNCIQACKKRFADSSHINYYVNDGESLNMISDNTINFVFSFDSLVHAEETTINAYLSQLSNKLKENGVAFIHHSNLGEYRFYQKIHKIPKLFKKILKELGIVEYSHWRSLSMSANKFELFANESDLKCITQEIVTWGTKHTLIDCLSTVVKKGSIWSRKNRVLKNSYFMKEANYLKHLSFYYGNEIIE